MKICNLTSVHSRYDVRIFLKQCFAQKEKFETHLIVADNQKSEIKEGVHIHGVKGYKNRFLRMTLAVWNVYRKAKKVDSDIYIFHDPELMFVGLALKNKKKRVYFDAHECYVETFLDSPWIYPFLKKPIIYIYNCIQRYVLNRLDGCLAATEHIEKKLKEYSDRNFLLPNYTLLREFKIVQRPNFEVAHSILYCGGITEERGIVNLIKALELCDRSIRLTLCGIFANEKLQKQCMAMTGWAKVDYKGFVNRNQLYELASKCFCGIFLYMPIMSHITALPNKMFEYSCMSLPIIASNFPSWEKIINNKEHLLGLAVDPENPQKIEEAIDNLFHNKQLAKHLGQNGRKAIEIKYNFEAYINNYLEFLVGE